MKKLPSVALIAAVVATTAPARAAESGLTLALRAGFGIPMGNTQTNDSLSDALSSKIPLWVDAGYRFDKHFFAGAYFQYAFGMVNSSNALGGSVCNQPGVSCSAYVMRFGIEGIYTFMPEATFAPWVGIGTGYELGHLHGEGPGGSVTVSPKGFEFFNLQVGGDYRVSPLFSVGPYAAFSLGQYSTLSIDPTPVGYDDSIASKSVHEWLQFGLKGTLNL